ncbi:uncharacterized protein LOC126817630 [Patella vulgata]|uniref:uncharacterized protein LOC126817630 n=1 Tax=Patella vulgata TaxID=6465 RepID=UPI0024A9744D|nr:uncharacterized protein LOC126817630 [Patella vulgata]
MMLLSYRSDDGRNVTNEVMSMNDPMAQKFSVTSHPSLPILLFSDGYNVTLIQLPGELTSATFMTDLLLESTKHLEYLKTQGNLDMTLVNAYNLSDRKNGSRKVGKSGTKTSTADRLKHFLSNLDDADVSLNETQTSELSVLLDDEYQYGGMQEMTSGKIMFGENEQHLATMDGSFANMGEKQALFKHFQRAKLNLFTVWKLAATCTENWTSRLDSITKDTVKNIYKMFTLMINSVPVTDMLAAQNTSAQNSALVNVITMYRQLLDVLQFDSLEQHLIPSTLQLAHKTITLVLNNKTINQSDPRLKTLSGCYMLLKFTEKVMNRNYIWLPRSLVEKGLSPRSMLERPDQCVPVSKTSNKPHVGAEPDVKSMAVIPSDQLSARRLTGTWKVLYQALLEFRRDQSISEADVQQSQLLVDAIHQTLQTVDTDIPGQTHNVNPGDAYSLDGQYTHALDVWLQQYRLLQGERGYSKSAKLLHSLLYTFILRGELLTAVDFIDELVVKANTKSGVMGQTLKGDVRPALMTIVTTTMRTQGSSIHDIVPCIRDKGIRQVVQTMARFMAAYFTNQSMYIFPPHNPQPLPAIHFNTPLVNNRIIPQYPEEITQIIRYQKLGDVWTVERTLEYLLLSGLVCEATWFAVKMGDWKAGYLLSVACEQHKQTSSTLYTKPRKPLTLPDHLRPFAILQDRLNILFGGSLDQDPVVITNDTDIDHLTQTIKELLTAGIMCKVEVVPWLLDGLIHKLKKVVKNLYPLVPSDFYLPSPPLYCPQPTRIKQQQTSPPSLEKEEKIREQISSLIQLILSVLSGSHLSLPCITWYTKQLISIQEKAKQFRANTEGPCAEVPSILQQYQSLTSHLSQFNRNYSTQHVLTCFRDFCSLLWLLHARDKLSLKLREKEKFLNRIHSTQSKADLEDKDQQAWLQECFTTLQWAVHLLSFCHYLPDESSMYKVVLSLLMELPPSEDTADILAEHYYDFENLDPEIQEKLEKILYSWEGVIVTPEDDGKSANKELNDDSGTDVRKSVTFYGASPRGKSLATYFSKQCQAVTKVLKKKGKTFGSFEEFVFNNGGEKTKCYVDLHIGSRQFETKQSYFEFLDTFAAVSFEKLLDLERSVNRPRDLPLLGSFADAIISRELAVFSERDFTSAEKKKYSLIVMSASRSSSRSSLAFARSQSILTQKYNSNLSLNQEPTPGSKSQGLFRSKSVVEETNKQGVVKRFNSEGGLDVLVEDSPSKSFFDHSQKSPRKGSQQNVTNLASKFSQSEDHLYKPDVDENNSWSLDVKFGRKYKLLQLLLEWLEAWCRKSHSFGLGQQDIFDSHPTIKIQIPAQLILLSLWLLENKYNPNTYAIQDAGQGFISEPQERKKKIKKKVRQASIEKQHASPVRSPVRSQLEQSLRNSRSQPPDQFVGKSYEEANKTTTSEDGIRNAYQHILEGDADDESCDSESTLQSYDLNGELKQSLSVIRGTGSPTREDLSFLNRTVYPDSSPERNNSASPNTSTPVSKKKGKSRPNEIIESSVQSSLQRKTTTSTRNESITSQREFRDKKSSKNGDRASSPNQSKNSSLERSSILKASLTSSLERSTSPTSTKIHTEMNARSTSPQMSVKATRSRSRSPDTKGQQGHVSRRQSYNDSGFNSSLANQLQNIVRSEMRRIMEVQHHSLMAMMGAIDDTSVSSLPTQHRVLREPPQRQQQSTRHRSPERRHDSLYNPTDNSMNLDELETSLHRSSNKLDKKGPVKVDRVLQELKYLQHENIQPVASGSLKTKPAHGKENKGFPLLGLDNSRHVGYVNAALKTDANNVNLIPKFLRMTAERDTNQPNFFFPKIPQEAWSEHQPHHKQPREPIQLLKLQSYPQFQFKNLANKIPILPPAPASGGQPPQRSMAPSKDPKHRFGIPLLQLQETKPPYIELGKESHLGQFVNPEQLLSPEQLLQKVESEKEKIQKMKEQTEEKIQTKKIITTKKRSKVVKVKQTSEEDILQEEDEEEEEESETEEQEPLHDGYAIKPGAFDHHLRLDEILGSEADTDTRFQYLLALKMKEQRQKKKKVDFSTMTKEMIDAIAEPDPILEAESARRADAWTSITKDTGSDPIQEAVIEYNKRQHGRVLPPDIYLKLGFKDGEEGENQERGRSYLNVVDIRASDVFNDIPDRDDKQDERFQPSSTRHQHIGETEELLRESLEPVLPPRHYGYDPVTAKMLDRKNRYTNQDSLYLGVLPRESMRYSKTSLIKRLRELNDQVAAIDEMSNNIEQDFESSRRVMTSSMEDKQKPTISQKSPVASARKSARTTTRRSTENKQTEDVRLSGLSDLSDIIGEVLLEGGVDLEATGLSHEEAEALKFKAESRRVIYGSTGVETLEELIHKTDATEDKEEKRRVLQKWMADRHVKQQDEYRERLDKLREHEIHPYRTAGGFDSTFTGKEIETHTRERQETRRQQEAHFMRQRLLEAEILMGDILVEQPAPSLLPVPSPRQPPTPKSERAKPPKLASKFSATRTIKKSPPPKKTPLRSVRKAAELKIKAKEWENMKPSVSSIRTKWRVDGRLSGTSITPQPAINYQKRQEQYERRMKEEKLAEIAHKYNMEDLELELMESEEYLPSAHTSSDLMEYVRQMAEHESPEDLHRELSPPDERRARIRELSSDERRARIEYKPKPFTKLVKLQRPEVTRKDIQPGPSESYVDRLASLTPRDTSRTDRSDRSSTVDIKEARRGSAPAIIKTSTQPEISGIRRVKTYAERLQEMKPKHKYSTPLVSRQSLGGTSSHAISSYRPSKPVGPAHKPVTYVQQLQKINREASTSKFKGKRSTPIPVRTVMRSHKPIHKPKTYVEQLKTINSEAPETIKRRALMQKTKTLQPGVIREQGRSRPYRDPYHDLDGDELHSVLSSWSVDDDVKKLLYDDENSVAYTAYAGTSQEYQISEGVSDYYEAVMADQYANSVDIDEITRIAEEASVDSGSVLSVIDWDRVDELIADVVN